MSDSAAVGGHSAYMEPSPFGIQSKKLTMWLFIASDAITFGAVLFGYAYLRAGTANWPTPFHFSPSIINGMVMTAVLLTSSLTMLGAVEAAKTDNKPATMKWLGVTISLGHRVRGAAFARMVSYVRRGLGIIQESGRRLGTFRRFVFSITGLHLMHVISGVIALVVIAIGYKTDWLDKNHVETTGLYWHFVDLVWMFVFPLVYLMNATR